MHDLGSYAASVQLWIIKQVGNSDKPAYTIQNACSRTYMDIPSSTSLNRPHSAMSEFDL